MRRIFAIASISMRTAFRSKVFLTLSSLLLLVIVGIPLTIRGDGTTGGYARIIIDYTLNFVRFILAVAAIWSGCASISQEVETKQIQMTATKPIHALQLWSGKWLGIVAPVLVLVLVAGVVVYGMLIYNLRPATLSEEDRAALRRDILVSRAEILPEQFEGLDQDIEALVQQVIQRGEVPPETSLHEVRRQVRSSVVTQQQTIRPGDSFAWEFKLPEIDADRSLGVQYRASASRFGSTRLPVNWTVYDSEGNQLYSEDEVLTSETEEQTLIPADRLQGNRRIYLQFRNLSEDDTIFFPREDSLSILAYAGGFELNLLRTLLLIALQLAFLTAIAVTMGAVFSTPVAAFTSVFILLLMFMDGYIHDMAQRTDYSPQGHVCSHGHSHDDCEQHHDGPRVFDRAIHYVFRTLDAIITPLREENALDLCATGRQVPWPMVGRTLLYRVVIYGGLIAVGGAGIFKRRELALPQR